MIDAARIFPADSPAAGGGHARRFRAVAVRRSRDVCVFGRRFGLPTDSRHRLQDIGRFRIDRRAALYLDEPDPFEGPRRQRALRAGQQMARPLARRPRRRHGLRLRDLRGDFRLQRGHRRDHRRDGNPRDAVAGLQAHRRTRHGGGGRHPRHLDPSQHPDDPVRRYHRRVRRQAVPVRRRPGHSLDAALHRLRRLYVRRYGAAGPRLLGGTVGDTPPRNLGTPAANPRRRRHLYRRVHAD